MELNSDGPGAHQNEENDEIFYVLEGMTSILAGEKWIDEEKETFIRIPTKTIYDFKNQTDQITGVLNFFILSGFERNIAAIVKWFEENK